jgi:hypothetical protein
MPRNVFAIDPVTREDFSLCVADEFGGADTAAYTLRVFHKLALRHGVTFWELYQMLRLETLGPESLDPDYIDPSVELEAIKSHARSDADLLAQPDCTLQDAVAAWKRAYRYFQLMALHHPDRDKRARAAAEVAERERSMTAILDRRRT